MCLATIVCRICFCFLTVLKLVNLYVQHFGEWDQPSKGFHFLKGGSNFQSSKGLKLAREYPKKDHLPVKEGSRYPKQMYIPFPSTCLWGERFRLCSGLMINRRVPLLSMNCLNE